MNYQSVLRTINSTDPDTAYLVVADQNGKQQTIVSDSKHPYFAQYGTDPTPPQPSPGKPYHGDIANAYWVNAANLEAGHKLIDDSGNWQTVVSVRVEPEPLNSYNLEVENDHTFFIRGLGGDAGIWVHNTDCFLSLPPGGTWHEVDGQRVYTVTYNQKTIHLVENKAFATGEASYKYGQVSIKNNQVRKIYTLSQKDSSAKNANSYINRDGAKAAKGHVYYQTDAEATIAAKAAGYEPIKDRIHGQKVYYNKENKTYITRDVGSNNGAGSHNGGVWKMAKLLRELGSKDTRMGTYDANFKKIGK